jgi:hypothetical protein
MAGTKAAATLAATVLLLGSGCAPGAAPSGGLPLYSGLDSYLHPDTIPYLELGDRVEGESTADPGGSNDDKSHVLGTLPDGGRVLFDQTGPGVLTFARMQEQTGAPWTVRVDGRPPVTIRSADLGQRQPTREPAASFPYPLSLNVAETQGSSILAAPVPYAQNLRLASAGPNGNFYALYRKLPTDAAPPHENNAEAARAAELLTTSETVPADSPQQQGTALLNQPGVPTPVTTIDGKDEIRSVTFRVPDRDAIALANARLQVFWDGEPSPSVDTPVKYLAGDGAGVYRPAGRPLVQSFPATVTDDGASTTFAVSWPMPFAAHARFVLVPGTALPDPVTWSIRYVPFPGPMNLVGTFHANFTDVPNPVPGSDMTFLNYPGSGKLVGTVVNFGRIGTTLEGDLHIFLDGSETPQVAVTGTEEWGMGGDYWHNGNQTSLPLAGLPSADTNPPGTNVDGSAEYRYLIADSIPFNNRIVVDWEHGAADESTEPYRAAMLWYGTPARTAIATDNLVPASPQSATPHHYSSPGDRTVALTAAYEQTVRSPLRTGQVSETDASSAFTMALDPGNVGAFLRRTLDSCVPNQRATVFVDGLPAGTWYNAGVSSRVGQDGHDRCWRDDDFPLPRSLTAGKSSVTIRIDNQHTTAPPNTVWTSAQYQLYSFVLP